MIDELERLLAEDGDLSEPIIRRFMRFVVRESRRQFTGFKRNVTANGTTLVEIPKKNTFKGAFTVSIRSGTRLVIGEGTVNGLLPRIGEVYIDGKDENGEDVPEGIPALDLDEGPGDRRRSYVCLRVRIDPATGAMNPDDPEALTIVHRQTLHPAFADGGSPDEEGAGDWPIAQLTWSANGIRVDRIRQWVFFDQTHRFEAGDGLRPGRHFFRPAA
jgi:hypothetical protein